MAGAPYYSSADVTLVLDTSLEHVTDGLIDVVVPVVVKGAHAEVTFARTEVPAIEISDEEVDFGEVQVGHQKTVYVQLHSRKGVPCEERGETPAEDQATERAGGNPPSRSGSSPRAASWARTSQKRQGDFRAGRRRRRRVREDARHSRGEQPWR